MLNALKQINSTSAFNRWAASKSPAPTAARPN